jgi:endogenous inhibitor of DNA gyrase (YacG/DUF329 family)
MPKPNIRCPQCRRFSEYSPANAYRPFCSERCKMIDLGAWASDQYSVPGKPVEGDDFTGLELPTSGSMTPDPSSH